MRIMHLNSKEIPPMTMTDAEFAFLVDAGVALELVGRPSTVGLVCMRVEAIYVVGSPIERCRLAGLMARCPNCGVVVAKGDDVHRWFLQDARDELPSWSVIKEPVK